MLKMNGHTPAFAKLTFLTEKAAECRRLAAAADDDDASATLSAMAEEFETLAAECAARKSSETAH
jgi:hypothetical protein